MKKIPLTKGMFALVDNEDFDLLSQWQWNFFCPKAREGTNYGYAERRHDGIRMHRLLIDATKDEIVDHINGSGLDNRRGNLRICTPSQNSMNARGKSSSFSGMKGVSLSYGGKWSATISVDGKNVYIGDFFTKQGAELAYNVFAAACHGEYAYEARKKVRT